MPSYFFGSKRGLAPRQRLRHGRRCGDLRPQGRGAQPKLSKCGQALRTPYPERCTECGTALKAWNSVTFGPEALGT